MASFELLEYPLDRWPSRVCIENVAPEIQGGRFPAKRVLGDELIVSADIHADGHDLLAAAILYRANGASIWNEAGMIPIGNDRWQGRFMLGELGSYEYSIEAWIDTFGSWKTGFLKKMNSGHDVSVDILIAAELLRAAAGRASVEAAEYLHGLADSISEPATPLSVRISAILREETDRIMSRYPDRSVSSRYIHTLSVTVDPVKALFSSWYEMFPRSAGEEPGRHGTFLDCERRLSYVAGMGFDVLYFPPIHPVGQTNRKGKNNKVDSRPEDVGSPWAIGSGEGGHFSINPQLGTLEQFQQLVRHAREKGIDIALDLAFQCSPDHPWIREHPEWFRHRPDGSIQYAENPPKRYEDIVPINFENPDWKALYGELLNVVLFWIAQGVRIFRVDNPHTKPYSFWEWLIRETKHSCPEVIFLSEAFTRPKVMQRLALLGFSQSYTYFTWRNAAWELRNYMTELGRGPVSEFLRPNLWPNTPDILSDYLQAGGRPAFQVRLILAATLASSYGIYGPAFELCENKPLAPGLEEYLNSEKFEIRHWNLEDPASLKPLIALINQIRRENPALQTNQNLTFHKTTNEQLLAYSKHTADFSNIVLTVINLDIDHVQSGYIDLPVFELGIDRSRPFQVHDLLGDKRYFWSGTHNYVEINPAIMPAHIFRLRRFVRTEHDFDYYL